MKYATRVNSFLRNNSDLDSALEEIGKIDGTKAIPFGQLVRRKDELDSSKKVVVVCKIGLLSAEVIRQLKDSGYEGEIYSLKGGITSWANDIDYTMARY